MRVPSRRSDDADVIRARLRALLAERTETAGWVPEDVGPGDRAPHDLTSDGPDPDGPRAVLCRRDDLGARSAGVDRLQPDAEGGVDTGGHRVAHIGADDEDRPTGPAGTGRRAVPPDVGSPRAPGAAVRLVAGRPGLRALWVVGVLAALLLAAWTWWHRPQVEPVPPASASSSMPTATSRATGADVPRTPVVGEAAATSRTVVVSVVGHVLRPGLVTLPTGSRVADAVAAAGGLQGETDATSVNMAAVLADGQQIAVGVPGSTTPAAAAAAGAPGAPVDLNDATAGALDALPGIGPVLAQRIVDYRTQHGRFASVDQLDDVPGIGPALYARLRGEVRV